MNNDANTPAVRITASAIEATILMFLFAWVLGKYGVHAPKIPMWMSVFIASLFEAWASSWGHRPTKLSNMVRRSFRDSVIIAILALIAKLVGML